MRTPPWPTVRAAHHAWSADLPRNHGLPDLADSVPGAWATAATRVAQLAPLSFTENRDARVTVYVGDEAIAIPDRVYNDPFPHERFAMLSHEEQVVSLAIFSRHHDGFVREHCMRELVATNEPWTAAYLLLGAGDWVAQVAEPLAKHVTGNSEHARATVKSLATIARENPTLFRTIRSRAMSYWAAYWRGSILRRDYPGIVVCEAVLDELPRESVLGW